MSQNNSSSGIGLLGVLGIVFVVLKLVGTIDWSWWLVLLPFYGAFVLIAGIFLGALVLSAVFDRQYKSRFRK